MERNVLLTDGARLARGEVALGGLGGKDEPEELDELAMLPPPVRFNSRSNSRPDDGKGEVEEETKAIVFSF